MGSPSGRGKLGHPGKEVVVMDRRKMIEKAIKYIVIIAWLVYTLKMHVS
ncbi:hypothetical protein FACS1894105_07490 [Clostridia bacterium]|nr:hypothetical protein FACS1894105_07490 [Clostridia bacterium]